MGLERRDDCLLRDRVSCRWRAPHVGRGARQPYLDDRRGVRARRVRLGDHGQRHRRKPSDAAKIIHGTTDAQTKQNIIQAAVGYLRKTGASAGLKLPNLKSAPQMVAAIKAQDAILEKAMAIGSKAYNDAVEKVGEAVLTHLQSQVAVYLHLTSPTPWPEDESEAYVSEVNLGIATGSEKAPMFLGGEVIRNERKKAMSHMSGAQELGVALKAMELTRLGVKSIGATQLRNSVKSELPDPGYPLAGESDDDEAVAEIEDEAAAAE